MQDDAEKTIRDWKQGLREEELAEKRRVAPGWLDRDEKILQPSRANVAGDSSQNGPESNDSIMDRQDEVERAHSAQNGTPDPTGDALDRAFGGMGVSSK